MAEALLKRHEAGNHRPTVEEIKDEEDVMHPPPSQGPAHKNIATQSKIIEDVDSTEPMSAKATGKHRATDSASGNSQNANNKGVHLDTASDEMFPELGTGAKAKAAVPAAWTSKKPLTPPVKKANGVPTHMNGAPVLPTSSGISSEASTPTSGMTTPSSSQASFPYTVQPHDMRGPAVTSLPGRYTDRIIMRLQDMKPRSQLKKPIQDILREINRRSKATIDMRTRPEGGIAFEGRGPQTAVREALREIAKELGVKVS
jgi:hypothetical protein